MSMTGKPMGLHGTGMKAVTLPQFGPEQIDLFKSLFGHLSPDSFMGRLARGDEDMFKQMEAPAHRQFQTMLGDIGSRFSGMGMGARRGSAFNLATGQAASDFAQDLQSKRMGLQQQAFKDMFGMAEMLMGQRPYETELVAKKRPFWQEMTALGTKAGIEGLMKILAAKAGNPSAAMGGGGGGG